MSPPKHGGHFSTRVPFVNRTGLGTKLIRETAVRDLGKLKLTFVSQFAILTFLGTQFLSSFTIFTAPQKRTCRWTPRCSKIYMLKDTQHEHYKYTRHFDLLC